ncbi:MAG: hypothetical protein PHS76_04875, partial [Sphaerochaeta sp.]|nr:hypothetical protein [Sphaerochaeta sp.]
MALCFILAGCTVSPAVRPEKDVVQTGAQGNAYKALICDGQDFSVLYGSDFIGVSSQNGATIYTEDEDELNRVDISVIYDGDTTGFDVSEYFYYRAEDMGNEDDIEYTLSEEQTQSSAGNAVMSGAVYSFTTEDGTAYRHEMLVDT